MPVLREYKEKGRVRYIGLTTAFEGQYAELVRTMRNEPIDFIGTDYALDNRHAEETILPLARDRGIAVLVYNMCGATGRLADEAMKKRMIELVEALPAA